MELTEEIGTFFKSIAGGFFTILGKVFMIALWALSALVILPCVFVAHFLYPMWEDWGKKF